MSARQPFDEKFSQFLTALGVLNYTFSNTESLLIHLMAGLLGTPKESAMIVFLTLNTTRARADLVSRLAKQPDVDPALRREVLQITGELLRHAPLRNRLNHCIYAFDEKDGSASSILMRIADRREELKIGETMRIDDQSLEKVERTTAALHALNLTIRQLIADHGMPA